MWVAHQHNNGLDDVEMRRIFTFSSCEKWNRKNWEMDENSPLEFPQFFFHYISFKWVSINDFLIASCGYISRVFFDKCHFHTANPHSAIHLASIPNSPLFSFSLFATSFVYMTLRFSVLKRSRAILEVSEVR